MRHAAIGQLLPFCEMVAVMKFGDPLINIRARRSRHSSQEPKHAQRKGKQHTHDPRRNQQFASAAAHSNQLPPNAHPHAPHRTAPPAPVLHFDASLQIFSGGECVGVCTAADTRGVVTLCTMR
jgi:hypothetical protein